MQNGSPDAKERNHAAPPPAAPAGGHDHGAPVAPQKESSHAGH
jgi:hypothetical protein